MLPTRVFDQPHYRLLDEVRGELLDVAVSALRREMQLQTAIDVACGLGGLTAVLKDLDFRVRAVDGRLDNIEEARRRLPSVDFTMCDVEGSEIEHLGHFDLVFCFGLLYHLENPFRAIRNLHALTAKVALIESMCTGEADPVMLLRDEGATEDQGLRHIAFYPSESCLRKMLYAAGFAFVYEFKRLPRHPHFQATFSSRRRRTVLAASMVPLTDKELFRHLPRQIERGDPWATPWSKFVGRSQRIGRFLAKPWHAKVNYVRYRWLKTFHVAVPVKLPWGAWWIAEYDFCGVATLLDGFEKRESAFVDSFLRPGMNVVDIGAHHGYYTLLSSRKTGVTGRVVAFEPSQRERKKLLRHLRLNRCGNVVVRDCALGSENGSAELFVVQGTETGCNSLRPPNVDQPVESLPVKIATLDGCLDLLGINRVDFIKMDVEGGEIEVLKGAAQLLAQRPRPVIMCEVQDIRTTPWGYPARLIVDFLEQRGFRWFSLSAKSKLDPMGPEERFDGNYIAVPEERIDQLLLHATDSAEASSSHLCA